MTITILKITKVVHIPTAKDTTHFGTKLAFSRFKLKPYLQINIFDKNRYIMPRLKQKDYSISLNFYCKKILLHQYC